MLYVTKIQNIEDCNVIVANNSFLSFLPENLGFDAMLYVTKIVVQNIGGYNVIVANISFLSFCTHHIHLLVNIQEEEEKGNNSHYVGKCS